MLPGFRSLLSFFFPPRFENTPRPFDTCVQSSPTYEVKTCLFPKYVHPATIVAWCSGASLPTHPGDVSSNAGGGFVAWHCSDSETPLPEINSLLPVPCPPPPSVPRDQNTCVWPYFNLFLRLRGHRPPDAEKHALNPPKKYAFGYIRTKTKTQHAVVRLHPGVGPAAVAGGARPGGL